MKRLILLFPVLLIVSCIFRASNDVEIEYSDGYTDIRVSDTILLDGFMYLPNALHDTLIDKTMEGLAHGGFSLGGLSYVQMWHIENDGSTQDTSWENLAMSISSGGGDTSASVVMQANYTADAGIAWDSAFRQKAIGYYTGGDSNPHWYATQTETTGLGSGDIIQYNWEWVASKTGTNILDTMLFHIAELWSTGGCDDIDTAVLIYKNGDTVRIVPTYAIDYTNDTLTWTIVDTTRSIANDTLKYGWLLDDDGTPVYIKTLNAAIANPSAPRWTVKFYLEEI